jgi:hypothetical protein
MPESRDLVLHLGAPQNPNLLTTMNLIIPRLMTLLFLCLLVVGLMKACPFLPIQSTEEKVAVEYRTCGIDDLPEQLRSLQSNKLVLVVVGDGVKDKTLAKTRPYSSNYAQGWDLYEGIAHASKKDFFKEISQFVEIVYVDDGGDSRCAELISEEIIKSPKVIAVIGHASTGTTKIALQNYKKASIPIIIPIATNPNLVVGCKNCFRLPSNDAIQAKAISDYAVNVLKGQNIYLVWDESESAKDYSEFLQSEVVNLIGSKIKFRQPITFRPMNYEYLLKSISYNPTDVLIFCGYGSMAREFLNGLRFEYMGKENVLPKPKVILSDGSKISDIKEVSSVFGFEAYLSFPSDKLASKGQFANFDAEPPPRGQEQMQKEESYELFGYDALALFSLTFKRVISKGDMSRQMLIESLAVADNSTGSNLCYSYKFEHGENVDARYFIYSIGTDSIERSYDSTYLGNVFADKPVAELVGRYDSIATVHPELLDALASKLKSDPNAKTLIIISDDREADESAKHALQLLRYLLSQHKIETGRIEFALGVGAKEQAQIWLVPNDATSPTAPEKHTTIKGENLLTRSTSEKKRT